MKKIALALLAVAVAVSPAAAASKKKGKTVAAAAAQPSDPNANTWKLLKDGMPLVLPSWALPIYFGLHLDAKKDAKKM
jgi:hypothetical protein